MLSDGQWEVNDCQRKKGREKLKYFFCNSPNFDGPPQCDDDSEGSA